MKNFRIYKPNQAKTGAASQFQLAKKDLKFDNIMLFLESAKQTGVDEDGNSTFAWKDNTQKISMKLGETDIGEILTVLNGLKDVAGSEKGIYHQNAKGNTVLNFSKYVKDGKFIGYGLRLSRKNKEDAQALTIQHLLSLSEGEVLRVLLNKALELIYQWD